jgi:hypothetical protein
VTHLRAGAVAVVRERLDEDRHAARAVALVDDGLDRRGVLIGAGALGDGALDVVLRHARFLRLGDGEGERGVAVGVPAAVTRGDGDGAHELGELGTAPSVDDLLLVLDRRPFGVAGHGAKG